MYKDVVIKILFDVVTNCKRGHKNPVRVVIIRSKYNQQKKLVSKLSKYLLKYGHLQLKWSIKYHNNDASNF